MFSKFKILFARIYDIIYSHSGTCTLLVFWIGITAFLDNVFVIEYGFMFPLKMCSSLFFVDVPVRFFAFCFIITPYFVIFSECMVLTPLMFIHKASHLIFALYQCRKPFKDESNGFDYRKAKQLLCIFFSYSELIRNVVSLVKKTEKD